MKQFIVFSAISMCSLIANGQSIIDSLIAKKQYLSAFEYLEQRDSANAQPDIVLQKVDVALKYYFDSEYHRAFSFINLRKGEKLEELRAINSHGETPFVFVVDSVLIKLMDDYPNDYRLHKALAEYYNQIYYDFGDRWGQRSEVLLEKSHYYFIRAYEHGVYDYYSLYALGYYQTLFENYFEAQRWYLKSLERKPDEPLTNYNLAVTYLFDGLPKKGIEYSEKAYELYADSLKKGDAARITGILYSKIGQEAQSMEYFQIANELSPNYRPNQLYLLKSYLQLNKDSLAKELGYKVLISSMHGPELAEEFIEMFDQFDKENELCQIFDRVLLNYSTDPEACGNICFHYGKLLYKMGERRKVKPMIKRSKNYFEQVFDPNHQVFEAIDQMLNMAGKRPF